MTRARPWLALTALLLGACASASGIRPDPEAATTSTSVAPATTSTTVPVSDYGGTVVIGVGGGGSPRTLNPFLDGPDTAVLDLIAPAVFAKGYDVGQGAMTLVPNVLEAIPSVAAGTVVDLGDGTIQVSATVATGAMWADGVPITAEDLAYTVLVASDPALPIRSDVAQRYAGILVESLDPQGRTLTFRMHASTEYELMFDVIIPRHAVEGSDFADAWNSTMWVAGGPFQFESWIPGQSLELTRNDSYWRTTQDDGPLPFLDRVIFRFYEPGTDPDPRLFDGFASRELDVVTLPSIDDDAAEYEALGGVELVAAGTTSWDYVSFQFGPANRNEDSLNRHLSFRRAIAHAIDRNGLAAQRGTVGLTSALSPYGDYGATLWDRYPHDPGNAAALIGELGLDLGADLTLGAGPPVVVTVPADDAPVIALAGQVVTMLREAGFDAQLQLEDAATFYGPTFDNGTWDVSVGRFTAGPGIARAAAFAVVFDPAGLPFVGNNFFRWGTIDSTVSNEATEEYEALVDSLQGEADPAEVERLVERAEEILADQVVIIPLVVDGRAGFAYRSGELAGPSLDAVGGVTWGIGSWTRRVTDPVVSTNP